MPKPLPKLIFLHLDRTGGTSVINCLRQLYESRGQHFLRSDTPVFGQADCIAGHFPFNSVSAWTGYLCITILRHPADREFSVLGKSATTLSPSLDQRVRVRTAQRDMHSYLRCFIRDGLYASRYSLGPPSIDSAQQVLSSLDLVGVTPKLSEFHLRLCSLLSVSPGESPLQHTNGSSTNNPFTWTAAQHADVTAKLRDDGILYQHAWNLAKLNP